MQNKIIIRLIAVALSICSVTSLALTTAGATETLVSTNDTADNNTKPEQTEIPSSYNSRDNGFVTEAEKQLYNDCWAYASLSAFESKLLHDGIELDSDFSENHMNVWATTRSNNTGWIRTTSTEGFAEIPLGYLTSWHGAVTDSSISGLPILAMKGDNIPTNLAGYGVTSIEFFTSATPDKIKQAIMEHGGLYSAYAHTSRCMSKDNTSYYLSPKYNGNKIGHAIEVIGWDDNYPKENFNGFGSYLPENNGAWLVKSSWGADFNSLGGCYWISYEDMYLFGEKYAPSFAITGYEKISEDVRLEQNEIYGATYEFSYIPENTMTYINVFDFSNGYNSLDKIIFESTSKDAEYSVYYVPMAFNQNSPNKDKSQWTKLYSGVVDHEGYICADIEDFDLPVTSGGIAIEITANNNYETPNNTIGVNEWLNRSTDKSYVHINNSQKGKSYICYNDTMTDLLDWYQTNNNDNIGGTFVIKAVTNKTELSITLLGDVDLNNNININDATTLARYLADLSDLSEVKKLNGDFDGNEILNINDITSIQRFIAEN